MRGDELSKIERRWKRRSIFGKRLSPKQRLVRWLVLLLGVGGVLVYAPMPDFADLLAGHAW